MQLLLILLAALAAAPAPKSAVIEANIRGTAQPLVVELLVRDENEAWKDVAREGLTEKRRSVRFEHLAAGAYQLRVRGTEKTEVFATKVIVGDGDTRRAPIEIQPFELTGRVTHGGAQLGAGGLVLRHAEFQWRVPIALAADGTFRATLWQRGNYTYSVQAPSLATNHAGSAAVGGASPVRLSIDIPAGRISGLVRDAKTGAAVAGAVVALEAQNAAGARTRQVRTDKDGRFAFSGVADGRQTVRVISLQHLEPEPTIFDLGGAAKQRELDVRLDGGRAVPLLVLDAEQKPAAEARVFAAVDGKLCARTRTDEDGRATIAIPERESAALFVIPESGGFVVQRVAREQDGNRLRIHVPRAASSLVIQARTTEGKAMPPFSLLMRYNGELVPPEVAEELAEAQGLQLATDATSDAALRNIPAGSYEFWPYRTDSEAESIVAAGATFAAPIQVNVRAGENRIAVKFQGRP
jgi:5-hydroxyisourate hydrolase-like protein (transthyretin family)